MADKPREIESQELKRRLDGGEDILLIDLLGPKSHASLHIPKSVPIDAKAPDRIDAVRGLAGGDMARTIVVSGLNFRDPMSTIVAEALLEAGFTDVWDYKGGLKDWSAELYPLEGTRAPKQ
jgi:rhodanese-related sulfurtransferase